MTTRKTVQVVDGTKWRTGAWIGTALILGIGACAPPDMAEPDVAAFLDQAPDARGHHDRRKGHESDNVIYVDADAPDGGDGGSWETAYNEVAMAVEAANEQDPELGRPTVLIAPGHYAIGGGGCGAQRIPVKRPMNIWGAEQVVDIEDGRATAVKGDPTAFATLEADPALCIGFPDPEAMFLVTSSGVDFRSRLRAARAARAPPRVGPLARPDRVNASPRRAAASRPPARPFGIRHTSADPRTPWVSAGGHQRRSADGRVSVGRRSGTM